MAGTIKLRVSLAVVLALVLGIAGTASAQLNKTDQKCRDSIAKALGKAVNSAAKVSAGCHKSRNSGKTPPATDCNDLSVGQADTKSKFAKAKQKLQDGITKSCTTAGASNAVLDHFLSCPEPCGTETGVPNPLASYADLGACLACVAGDIVERRNAVMLGAPAAGMSKEEQSCHQSIAKGYDKHLKTLLKDRQGCQKDEDADGNLTLQPCDTSDPKGKIGAAATAAATGVSEACTGQNLADIDSCSAVDVASLNACLLAEENARGAEAFSDSYETPATICPVALTVRSRAGFGAGGATSTRLEAGWNGVGHGQDLVDQYAYGVALSCANSSPPCGTCTVTGFTDTGVQSGAFTRCRENISQECSNPFGIDATCPGLQQCGFYLGPPLPLSASNTPVCVIIRAEQQVSGSADIETGDSDFSLTLRSVVHTGITLTQPCPRCIGDATPQDGNPQGTCEGGVRHGLTCDVQGFDSTFGDTSMDCPPGVGTNISGQGLLIDSSFTTGTTSMPFGTACDFPLGSLDCACAVCTGDTTVPCNDDQTCIDLGAGTCTSNGAGATRAPNGCSDLTCTDIGNELGECDNGPDVHYCDLQLRANGSGYIACDTNADCSAVDTACDNGDCGDCTLEETRPCFLDPVESAGTPDPDAPIIAGTFCTPPTSSSGVNNATGLPGPSRVTVQLEIEREY